MRIKPRVRQQTTISFRAKLIIGTSCFLLIAVGIFVSLNVSNVQKSLAASTGDYRSSASGNWEDASVWETYDGKDWQPSIVMPPNAIKNIIIKGNTAITVNTDVAVSGLVIETNGSLKINTLRLHITQQGQSGRLIVNGILDAGNSIIDGNGDFKLNDNSEIIIGSPDGLSKFNSGNVQVIGTRYYSSFARYTFKAKTIQHTGNGLPSGISVLTIENPEGVMLESNLYISSQLLLKSGTLNTLADTLFLGSGKKPNASVTRYGGGIAGNFKRWLNKNTMNEALFPLMEGLNYNGIFISVNADDYSGGAFTFSFVPDNIDNKEKGPNSNSRIIIIGESGYYRVTSSEGFEDGAYKLVTSIAVSKHENKSYWKMNAKNNYAERKEEPTTGTNAELVSNIIIAPNPFHEKFTLKFNLAKESEVEINLLNGNGQLIFNDKINGHETENSYQYLDQRNLPPGNYILRIIVGDKTETRKLIKQ